MSKPKQSKKRKKEKTLEINRAPVLALWGSVVAETEGWEHNTALTIGSYISTMLAQAKGRRLGIFEKKEKEEKGKKKKEKEVRSIKSCGFSIVVKDTTEGTRAYYSNKVLDPKYIEGYLQKKFGEELDAVKEAMEKLAQSLPSEQLSRTAFQLYEKFRPTVPEGVKGWGKKGVLSISRIEQLAQQYHSSQEKEEPEEKRAK